MTVQTPIPDFDAARAAMVDSQLRPQGVTDRGVLAAMGSVAREEFVPSELRPLAYIDRSLEVGEGQYLSPPPALGQLLTQIAPKPGEKALVIGGGGYSAAVLEAIGCEVTAAQGASAVARTEGGSYDIVLVDGAMEAIPEAFIHQLADGGRLGGALVDRGVTRLIVGRKSGTAFGYLSIGDAAIAPLPGLSRPSAFTF